jgi:Domain of unknown function (DUF4160)
MTKDDLMGTSHFHWVNPNELEGIVEWVEYLDALLHGPCKIWEEDNGELVLIEIRALIATVSGLKLEIYPNEHPPPHFHVKSSTTSASFRVDNCERLHGDISHSDYKKIKYWHQFSKPLLIEKWNSMRPTTCQVGAYREAT